MEAASVNFIRGLEYLRAARSNENPDECLNADEHTREILRELARHYRDTAMSLIMQECPPATGDVDAEGQLPRWGKVQGERGEWDLW